MGQRSTATVDKKLEIKFLARRKITFHLWYQGYPQAVVQVRLQHRHYRTRHQQVQKQNEVTDMHQGIGAIWTKRAVKNMLDDCLFPRRMRSALQWSRSETNVSTAYMLLRGNLCYKKSVTQKCCSSQISTRTSASCLHNVRHQTSWMWYGLGTKHAMDHGT